MNETPILDKPPMFLKYQSFFGKTSEVFWKDKPRRFLTDYDYNKADFF